MNRVTRRMSAPSFSSLKELFFSGLCTGPRSGMGGVEFAIAIIVYKTCYAAICDDVSIGS